MTDKQHAPSIDSPPLCRAAADALPARKPAEREIEHLNRVLLSIRSVNRLITREEEPHRLIQAICELLIEQRGYLGAMIVVSDEAGKIGIYSAAGLGEKFKPLAESLDKGELPPCCAGAKASAGIYYVRRASPRLRQNAGAPQEGACYVDYPSGRCAPCPIVSLCAGNKTMCLSLVYHGRVEGYLAVSVDASQTIGKEEQDLFQDVAGDAAVALHSLAQAETVRRSNEKQAAAEAQLRQAQKIEAVGLLAGGVAHDFNNILTAVMSHAEFIRRELPPGDPKLADVQEILTAADRAAALTRQLLAFGRKQIMAPRVVDLNKVVGGMTKMLSRLIGEDIKLTTKLVSAPCLTLVDPGQMEQVIMNLAINARDAMPKGGAISLETEILPPDERVSPGMPRGPLVCFRARDTGCGMTAEIKSRIFEPFFTTKEPGKGTGLGLSTVFGIIKQSGGEIAVESGPDKGTTFLIYLPLAETTEQVKDKDKAALAKGRETVLFVEDEESLRRLGTRILGLGGYTVLTAANGTEALAVLERHGKPVDLLLTDVVMPGMDGRELAFELVRRKLVERVLYMSGYTDDAILKYGVLEHGFSFIYKPFTVDAVLQKLREVLDAPADQARA